MESTRQDYPSQIGYFDGELRYVLFLFQASYNPPAALGDSLDVLDAWDDHVKRMNNLDTARETCDESYQSSEAWVWLASQEELIRQVGLNAIVIFARSEEKRPVVSSIFEKYNHVCVYFPAERIGVPRDVDCLCHRIGRPGLCDKKPYRC